MSAVRSSLRPLSVLLLLSAFLTMAAGAKYIMCVFTGSRNSDSGSFVALREQGSMFVEFVRFQLWRHDDNEVNSRDCHALHFHVDGEIIEAYLKRKHIGNDTDWQVKKLTLQGHHGNYTCTNGGETKVNDQPVKFPCKHGIHPDDLAAAPAVHGSAVLVLITMCTMPILLNSLL